MTYEQIKNLKEKEFKRLCGVKPKVFDEMVDILKKESPKRKCRGGQAKLTIEDRSYRNRRRRFGLRFNLIAGLYNCGID